MRFPPAVSALAATLLLAGAAAAAAQTPDSIEALTPGHRALAFNLPNGGGAGLGVWKIVAPDHARGFFMSFNGGYSHGHGEQDGVAGNASSGFNAALSLGPQARRYLARSAPVAPFVQSGLSLGGSYNHGSSSGTGGQRSSNSSWSASLGASVGAGVEWFPFRRVSIAGQTGVAANTAYSRSSSDATVSGSTGRSWSWGFGVNTFVSSLALQLYF